MPFGVSTAAKVLRQFCTVTVYTDGQDTDGSPKRSGSTVLYENLPCWIQPLGSRRGVEQGRTLERRQFRGWFPTHTTAGVAVTFGQDARITHGGRTYRPTSGLTKNLEDRGPYQIADLEVKT